MKKSSQYPIVRDINTTNEDKTEKMQNRNVLLMNFDSDHSDSSSDEQQQEQSTTTTTVNQDNTLFK